MIDASLSFTGCRTRAEVLEAADAWVECLYYDMHRRFVAALLADATKLEDVRGTLRHVREMHEDAEADARAVLRRRLGELCDQLGLA